MWRIIGEQGKEYGRERSGSWERHVTDILIGMVGDLLIDRDQPDDALAEVGELLSVPDILFGNLEANFTDDPHSAPSAGIALFPGGKNLDAFSRAGFDVLSMANNHIVDAGHVAMLENRARLRAQGVKTCGAGENIDAARRPALIETKGVTTAFLAYASVFPMGYEARSNVPGLVPFRAYDLYRPVLENYHVPGTPPSIQTVSDERDLAALTNDLAQATQHADLVFTSFHWGDFMRPFHLTDHERRTARWCIDHGADMVIGHHHHALRGMEWYRGKPILYGLGHFVFDLRLTISDEFKAMCGTMSEDVNNYGIFPREGWPLLPLHPDTRLTLLAWARANDRGVNDIGFVPCRLRPDGRTVPVDPEGSEGREVVEYLQRCITSQNLNARMTAEGAPSLSGHKTLRVVPLNEANAQGTR
jgi:poly-gamma-glutamate capsule biosynthesis protein CapA/YwtB (metallophosphatase superfamily)